MANILKYFFLIVLIAFGKLTISQDSLVVVTYNIEGMKPGSLPGLRLGSIIAKLKVLNPDIIALQEVNEDINGNGSDNQGMLIAEGLSEYFGSTFTYYQQNTHLSWDNQFREYIGIISKYPVEDSGYFQLIQGVFPRKVVWNYIDAPLGKINFFCTHLSFNSQAVRIEQSQQVAAYIQSIQNENPAIGTILCGDFNDPSSAPTITQLTDTIGGNFFFDTFRAVNPNLSGNTVPSNGPSSRIDYVFLQNQSQIHVDSSEVIMQQPISGNIYCSDHLGVISIFKAGTQDIAKTYLPEQSGNFILRAIGPNPISNGLRINIDMLKNANMEITLLTLTGNELEIVFNQMLSTGIHQINYQPFIQDHGVYLLRFSSGDECRYHKIILSR